MDQLAEVAKVCERLLGAKVRSVEASGGPERRSVRVFLEGRSVIATRRRSAGQSRVEADVLRALGPRGAPVPAVLAFDGRWLVQADLGSTRLSQKLAPASEAGGELLLAAAAAGLAAAQRAGQKAGLDRRVAAIGTSPDWLMTLATMPARLGAQLGWPCPVLPTRGLVEQLRPRRAAFIKWDARPGNAVVRPGGTVGWFDWEHCGCRHPLDDLAWLLCDEYTPDWPAAEARLILSPVVSKWLAA